MVAARSGAPNLQPDADTTSATDILTGGGGQTRIAGAAAQANSQHSGGGSCYTGSGASGGSTVEAPADSQSPATDADPNASGAPPATDSTATPSGAAGTGTAATDPHNLRAARARMVQKRTPTRTTARNLRAKRKRE